MKILFTCDLHGRKRLYESMLLLGLKERADCIVIGGDLFPTIVKDSLGLIMGNPDFSTGLKCQYDFIDNYAVPLLGGFAKRHPEIEILYIPGNHDWHASIKRLESMLPQARNIHNGSHTIKDISFIGYGCVTDSPFWLKDYVRLDTDDSAAIHSRYAMVSTPEGLKPSRNCEYARMNRSIKQELADLPFDKGSRTISVFHNPPYNTGLDTLYDGTPIGSRSILEFIKEKKPLASLHGHIHESPYMSNVYHVMIGKSLVVNPGQRPNMLHASVFDTDAASETLMHNIFGKKPPKSRGLDRVMDRMLRKIKGLLIKQVLLSDSKHASSRIKQRP